MGRPRKLGRILPKQIKIDKKKIPIPTKRIYDRKSTYGKSKYPFLDLKIKESFHITTNDLKEARIVIRRISTVVQKMSREGFLKKRKFTIRKSPTEVRVWRIK